MAFNLGDRVPRLERAMIKILAQVSLGRSKTIGLRSFEWIEDDKHMITMRFPDIEIEVAVTATVTKVISKDGK